MTSTTPIKALIINVDPTSVRMTQMVKQLDAMGIEWVRPEPVHFKALTPEEEDPYWRHSFTALTVYEAAAFGSHLRCWEMVAQDKSPFLILEDDIVFSTQTAAVLTTLARVQPSDLVNLETAMGRKALGKETVNGLAQLHENDLGAGAYVLWPSGAKKLIRRAQSYCAAPDIFLINARDVSKNQCDPAPCVQSRFSEMAGVQPTLPQAVTSTVQVQADTMTCHALTRARMRFQRSASQMRRMWRKRFMKGGVRRKVVPFAHPQIPLD